MTFAAFDGPQEPKHVPQLPPMPAVDEQATATADRIALQIVQWRERLAQYTADVEAWIATLQADEANYRRFVHVYAVGVATLEAADASADRSAS